MYTSKVKTHPTLLVGTSMLSVVLLILMLGGCASTSTDKPGPGKPDAMQLQHSEMLKLAIEAKDRINALAALALFEGDIFRWHTNTLTEATAITELLALTDAVDKEDWASANKLLIDLKMKYRPE